MELHYAAPTTRSPASAKLICIAVGPRVTPRQMLDCPTKSSTLFGFAGDAELERPAAEYRLQTIISRLFRELYIDFCRCPSIRRGMANDKDNEVRRLFTEIGCIMEDASLSALVLGDRNDLDVKARYRQISDVHTKIGELLSQIVRAIRTSE